MGLLLALVAGAGVYLLYTSLVLGVRGVRCRSPTPTRRRRRRDWLVQAGLADVPLRDLVAVIVGARPCSARIGAYAVFGGVLPALATAAFAATFPLASYRVRRRARRAAAMDAWPRLLEELRILTSSLGRSIPQALFEVGRRAPEELRPAFAAAQREWLLSTDFARTLRVLKAHLADPTADAVCETLLVAHEVGGTDLDRRLEALDRRPRAGHAGSQGRAGQAGRRAVRAAVRADRARPGWRWRACRSARVAPPTRPRPAS